MLQSGRRVACIVLVLAVPVIGAPATGPVVLVQKGQCDHQIALQPGASASEQFAAEELQSHFEDCTGVVLPIVQGVPAGGGSMIVLGCGDVAQGFGVDPGAAELGEQGYLLRTVPPHIVIAGTKAAGTMYGVHRFLEDHLGVRWYAPGVTKTPTVTNLTIPSTDSVVQPAFLMRNTSYRWPGSDGIFHARVGNNRNSHDADHPQGIGYRFDGSCHTYFRFVSPWEFFDSHPEYFSEIGGVRFGEETQLCLTNPEVLDIVTERMLQRMADRPNHRQHNFSQMDYYNYCECENCSAMNAEYGTLGGTQFWFVNELAKRTSVDYPDKQIGTLAYTYTAEPPVGMQMHENVAVWLCHMYPSCDSHAIQSCPLDSEYERQATAWSQICSHLYMWHYIVDFTHYYTPFPNLRAMAADMRFYRDLGVEGVYLQAMSASGGGGEFSLLRPYYGMKLLWDPDQDADAILLDFLNGYYGAAAGPIWQYITILHDKVDDENIHMHLYTNPAQGYLSDDVVSQAMSLFDQAEAAVQNDPVLLDRVRVARMPLTYARVFPRNGYEIQSGQIRWQGGIASLTEAAEFVQLMVDHGFYSIREAWGGDRNGFITLAGLLNSRPAALNIQNGLLSIDVVPHLGARALRIVHTASGKCITAFNNVRALWFPFAGGMEHRIGETFRYYGWMDAGTVLNQTGTSITTGQVTADGWQLVRTLTLPPGESVVEVETTVVNPRSYDATLRLRSHLELNPGDLQTARVRFTDRGGAQVDKDMTAVLAGLRQGEHFYADSAPAGSWTFSGSRNMEVTHTFEDDLLDFTWLYAYPESDGQLDLEMWLKRQQLPPGGSVTLRETLEVVWTAIAPVVESMTDQNVPIGEAYAQTLNLLEGTTPVAWTKLAGPDGLTVDPNTGAVSWPEAGPPDSVHTVTVEARNERGTHLESWTVTVTAPPVIAGIASRNVEASQDYVEVPQLEQGHSLPIAWSLVAGPPDMQIDPNTGEVAWANAGPPDQQFGVTLKAENDLGEHEVSWDLTVVASPLVEGVPDRQVQLGQAYTETPNVSRGYVIPIAWSLVKGPADMTVATDTGVVDWPSPTPPDVVHAVTLRAVNDVGEYDVSWQITVTASPVIRDVPDRVIPAGRSYAELPGATRGHSLPITWSIVQGPPGLAIDAVTGAVSWPDPGQAATTATVTIRAQNDVGAAEGSWQVAIVVMPQIDPIPSRQAVFGEPYTETPSLSEGQSFVTWSLRDGPQGMEVDPDTGVVTWKNPTPVDAVHAVRLRASNAAGTDDVSYELTVAPTPSVPVINAMTDQAAGPGSTYVGPSPWLVSGTKPVTWSLVDAPAGMSVDPETGVVTWPNATHEGSPHRVALRATNVLGWDDESWTVSVAVPNRSITFSVAPAVPELALNIDGNRYAMPQTFAWQPGSVHEVSVDSPQALSDGTVYRFDAWNDGESSTSRTIVVDGVSQYVAVMRAVTVTSLFIAGPDEVGENATASYRLTLGLSDGTAANVTSESVWRLSSDKFAEIAGGELTAHSVETDAYLEVHATLDRPGFSQTARLGVTILDVPETCTLSVSTSPGGTAAPLRSTHTGGQVVTVLVPAAPEEGMVFAGWTGDAAGTTNPLRLTMDADKSVVAQFVKPDPNTGAASGAPCAAPAVVGGMVFLMALALTRGPSSTGRRRRQ